MARIVSPQRSLLNFPCFKESLQLYQNPVSLQTCWIDEGIPISVECVENLD